MLLTTCIELFEELHYLDDKQASQIFYRIPAARSHLSMRLKPIREIRAAKSSIQIALSKAERTIILCANVFSSVDTGIALIQPRRGIILQWSVVSGREPITPAFQRWPEENSTGRSGVGRLFPSATHCMPYMYSDQVKGRYVLALWGS